MSALFRAVFRFNLSAFRLCFRYTNCPARFLKVYDLTATPSKRATALLGYNARILDHASAEG
jgi:hypothetical protein